MKLIESRTALGELCSRLADAKIIGLDTEFVSEDTYLPQLCLIQIAVDEEILAIDPLAVEVDMLWQTIVEHPVTTVVHSGREELLFCLRSVGKRPHELFDTQLAAAFIATEYPTSYSNLVARLTGHRPDKGETRTDWRRRPLSDAQLHYAFEDVRFLHQMYELLQEKLVQRGRLPWYASEIAAWEAAITAALTQQNWRRVSGVGGLSAKCQAIVRELWLWRDAVARERDVPARRVLRDDLIVELAKRQSPQPDKIKAVRGLFRGQVKKVIPEISAAIHRGLEADLGEFKRRKRQEMPPQLDLLGQFLTPALTTICREAEVAPSLVGTASDVRALVAYRLGFGTSEPEMEPALATGWRAELVGNLIDHLLSGERSIRIADPHREAPLAFDEVG